MLGDGPLYPIADFGGDAVPDLRDDERGPDGSYAKKVRWLGVGYTGPVLLRVARIDVRQCYQKGPDLVHPGLRLPGLRRCPAPGQNAAWRDDMW